MTDHDDPGPAEGDEVPLTAAEMTAELLSRGYPEDQIEVILATDPTERPDGLYLPPEWTEGT